MGDPLSGSEMDIGKFGADKGVVACGDNTVQPSLPRQLTATKLSKIIGYKITQVILGAESRVQAAC